jgi:hypothetical protein
MNTPELTLEKSLSIVLEKLHHIPNFKDYQEAKNIVLNVQEGLRDLSLARLQIESQGVTDGKITPSSTSVACAPPANSDVVPEKEPTITVCDKCLQASCWQGIFMCQESAHAGTVGEDS